MAETSMQLCPQHTQRSARAASMRINHESRNKCAYHPYMINTAPLQALLGLRIKSDGL